MVISPLNGDQYSKAWNLIITIRTNLYMSNVIFYFMFILAPIYVDWYFNKMWPLISPIWTNSCASNVTFGFLFVLGPLHGDRYFNKLWPLILPIWTYPCMSNVFFFSQSIDWWLKLYSKDEIIWNFMFIPWGSRIKNLF